MLSKVKTENDRPMEMNAEGTDNLNARRARSHSSHLNEEKEESYHRHTFQWLFKGQTPTSVTCNKAGTVEDSLEISPLFRELAEKKTGKELVVLREGKAIASHFPCSLIKDDHLTVKFVKAVKPSASSSVGRHRQGSSRQLVLFHVLTRGGKGVVKIMINLELNKVDHVTVYTYEGEKVKEALRRDGRFKKNIFTKNIALFNTNTEVTTEMSNLVDHLHGETYQIILLDKSSPPDSQPGSLDADMMSGESQRSEADENQNPSQQSATRESVNDNITQEQEKQDDNGGSGEIFTKIPDLAKIWDYLSSQFKEFMTKMKNTRGSKTVKPKLSRVQNILRVEFGKKTQTCFEVKTMKKLMDFSKSVCQVRKNGSAAGSGFLLFDKYVLTNYHVIKNIYNEIRGQLGKKVTVDFSFENLDELERGQVLEVEEVVGFEYCFDLSGHEYDWALLKLKHDQNLPDPLLTQSGFLLESGAICIIGHPDGDVKKVDQCSIIPLCHRVQTMETSYYEQPNHIQFVTQQFFKGVAQSIEHNTQILTYNSCFYYGSSGSPVFDHDGTVVAMHSGGFIPEYLGEEKSIVEYAYRLTNILEHIIIQLVERRRFDVLKAYLTCSYTHHETILSNVKKLVESRNLTKFKDVVISLMTTDDESLKNFFEFFCQKEEPTPMDISDM